MLVKFLPSLCAYGLLFLYSDKKLILIFISTVLINMN